MIEEFDQDRLKRRRAFLEIRAKAHLTAEGDHRWHYAASATLLRDAAAVAFIVGDIVGGRSLLRQSGNLFFDLGFAGGLQLLYISGALEADENEALNLIRRFDRAFSERIRPIERAGVPPEKASSFDDESFLSPQLLRTYQALAGRRSDDEEWFGLRRAIHEALNVNAAMPVGAARTPLATYLMTFDQLARRDGAGTFAPSWLRQTLNALAQRREELLMAARRDRFHWKAMLRPAELVDFDLLALLLAGVRRGKRSRLIATAFAARDPMTALPHTLAQALKK
jgi:hypothetical protein